MWLSYCYFSFFFFSKIKEWWKNGKNPLLRRKHLIYQEAGVTKRGVMVYGNGKEEREKKNKNKIADQFFFFSFILSKRRLTASKQESVKGENWWEKSKEKKTGQVEDNHPITQTSSVIKKMTGFM